VNSVEPEEMYHWEKKNQLLFIFPSQKITV
jgi:hypothetical protein